MSLDFAPHPAAAPAARRVWSHALMEARLIVRNGEQALLAFVIPVAILLGARFFGDRLGLGLQQSAPSVLALVLWSTCLTTLAIATGFERRYNVLERIAATPLGKPGILAGKGLGIALIASGQVVLLSLIALLLGWRPVLDAGALAVALLVGLMSMGAFAGLALSIAGSLRPEATLAVANLLYLVGMPLGVLLPVDRFPASLQPLIDALPTAALGESLRAAAQGTVLGWPIMVAALWCAGSLALARKVFTWTS